MIAVTTGINRKNKKVFSFLITKNGLSFRSPFEGRNSIFTIRPHASASDGVRHSLDEAAYFYVPEIGDIIVPTRYTLHVDHAVCVSGSSEVLRCTGLIKAGVSSITA